MKTLRLFVVGLFLSSSFLALAQNVLSNAAVTSGGLQAGALGTGNAFYGFQSGKLFTASGGQNSFFGNQSGSNTTNGLRNSYFGCSAGAYGNGSDNVSIGNFSLAYNAGAITKTTAIGASSGLGTSGTENIFIGYSSGLGKTGSNNIFIGNNVGESSNNKLNIDNAATATPLIWGDFALDQLKLNGKVGIGSVTSFPTLAGGVSVSNYKLFVTGGILTDEVRVTLSSSGTWADYVFFKDYDLKTLPEVETFIEKNGHLPNVPSAAQVKEDGIALGEMAKIQQEKIEELTLYLIQQDKEIKALKAQMQLLLNK